uniref:Uncharacterized protein n=1 Tax=Bicosoecida sp. CB-2014 TaxID=1486930 RepID=A0A7S1CDQ8_9STRA|mmetsp:Transcript_23213/g.80870  ORF Transcript_23213/g.80870 Transcript_23213/m.80870 type:complete len:411 (+) Transcript_23213:223-1455(+)
MAPVSALRLLLVSVVAAAAVWSSLAVAAPAAAAPSSPSLASAFGAVARATRAGQGTDEARPRPAVKGAESTAFSAPAYAQQPASAPRAPQAPPARVAAVSVAATPPPLPAAAWRALQAADCAWSAWDFWTVCSAECGGGLVTRNRSRPIECARSGDAAEAAADGRGISVDDVRGLQLLHEADVCAEGDCWDDAAEITPFCRWEFEAKGWSLEDATPAARDLVRAVVHDRIREGLAAAASAGDVNAEAALQAGVTTRVGLAAPVFERIPGEGADALRIVPGLVRLHMRVVVAIKHLDAAAAVTRAAQGDSFVLDINSRINMYAERGWPSHGDSSLRLVEIPEDWELRFTTNTPVVINNDRLLLENREFLTTILVGVVLWPIAACASCIYGCRTLYFGIWPKDDDDDDDFLN